LGGTYEVVGNGIDVDVRRHPSRAG
jgi:hypothetical protein